MLNRVETRPRNIEEYQGIASDELLDEVYRLAGQVKGLTVRMLNASGKGGGVAEILKSLIPLLKGAGLDIEWYVLAEDISFFEITKRIHNQLHGHASSLSQSDRDLYLKACERNAIQMNSIPTDVWVVHDPQPLATIASADRTRRYVWHCHIDTSDPEPTTEQWLQPYVQQYDRIIFHFPQFASPHLPPQALRFLPGAIDPLSPMNRPVSRDEARRILAGIGVQTARPLMTQLSRFDPWKDPIGVIDAYRLAKKEISDLQLALSGVILAQDDPEALSVYRDVTQHAKSDPDILLYTDFRVVGDVEVNAFQTASDVIVQKSLREGFGLTVTEAMWKGTPVVGGNVGGIREQIRDGENGFLVNSPEECAGRVVELVQNPALAERIGLAGKETARQNYLIPRLVRDYLRLLGDM